MVKVMIYDRDEKHARDLSTILAQCQNYYPLGVRDNLHQFKVDLENLEPDIVIVDAALAESLSQVKECTNACRHQSPLLMLVLDAESTPEIYRLLHLGFEGYMHRSDKWDTIEIGLRWLSSFGAYISPTLAKHLVEAAACDKKQHLGLLTPKKKRSFMHLQKGTVSK